MSAIFKAIGNLFKSPSPPPVMAPPPPPPVMAPPPPPTEAKADEAVREREKEDERRRKRGRGSLILTGADGVATPKTAAKTLLGG